MKIFYTPETENYLVDLAWLLYEKNYFLYFESAHKYVSSLMESLQTTLHLKAKHKAPSYFSKYGRDLWYASYPKSKHTTWYFFFTRHANNTYVIRYITNNHVEGHFIK